MSAEYQNEPTSPPADTVVEQAAASLRALEAARQRAAQARSQAAASGDYATAEAWYDRERTLDARLREQDRLVK